MKILITNVQLDHRTGTEIVVRDLELGLRRRGHAVCVYSPNNGILGEEIARRGGLVVTHVDDVPFRPDVIHAHHNVPALEASFRFPDTPMIFVCHDARGRFDMSSGLGAVAAHVAVDLNCRERLVVEAAPSDQIHLIPNAVDLAAVVRRSQPVTPIERAAVFGNNAEDGGFIEHIRAACTERNLPLDEFGSGVGRTLAAPELRLADYSVVFAKARCAIEAMTAGCAVVLIDRAGYGGLVTSSDVDWVIDWNAGDRCLQRPHSSAQVIADLERIDATDSELVTERVRERCSLEAALDAYEAVYAVAVGSAASSESAGPSWRGSFESLATFASSLEERLRSGGGDWAMPPLPPAAGAAISVTALDPPRRVAPGAQFSVDVEIANSSREQLSSTGPTPIHLSYHWLLHDGTDVLFDGVRTPLRAPVRSGAVQRQPMAVVAPDVPERLVLRITMVQEGIRWFSGLPHPIVADSNVVVADQRTIASLADIGLTCGVNVDRDALVTDLGFVSDPRPGMLSYAASPLWLDRAMSAGVSALVVPTDLAPMVPEHIGVIMSDAPAATLWSIHEALQELTDFYGIDRRSTVDRSARVHASAVIDEQNVRIGPDVIIGAGCVLTGRIDIDRGSQILPGAVIGSAGFQTELVDDRIVEFTHVGGVRIGRDVVVFSNATVARGLFRQDTCIDDGCRIGNNSFVSHNASIGPRSTIGHGAVVNGNVRIGTEVWLGPGTVVAHGIAVGDRAHVDLGSTVIGSVPTGAHVGGPPAIDHHTVLREVARWRARGRRR
ncbi:MAG: hypothetical protein JWM34_2300 [Ilumatobacteraceae bacterium]|nr:hypothetical protein [Ilumatobacteraceae bacterium]